MCNSKRKYSEQRVKLYKTVKFLQLNSSFTPFAIKYRFDLEYLTISLSVPKLQFKVSLHRVILLRVRSFPAVSALRCAIAEAKQHWSDVWPKIYYLELVRASEVTLSRWSRLHLQSLAPTNPHWARILGYGPFSLCVRPVPQQWRH
jgi:hypothetical protein